MAFVLALAVAGMSGVQLVSVSANPYQGLLSPETPDTSPPSVVMQSPSNKTYNVNTVAYSLTINKPSSWFNDDSVHGKVVSVSCVLDGGQRYITIADVSQNESEYQSPKPLNLKGNLSGLSEGNHDLRIQVKTTSYYYPPERANSGVYGWWKMPPEEFNLQTYSDRVYFAIDVTRPTVSIISPENRIYNTSEVPLDFVLTEYVSELTYLLDGENVTAAGNRTLTGLSGGEHNLTVCARDTAGNIGTSTTIVFSVVKETEPELLTDVFSKTWVATAIGTAITLGSVLAFSYHTKAQRRKQAQG